MIFLTKTLPGCFTTSKEEASMIVARELRDDWIGKNVYPAHENSVARWILRDYELFHDLRRSENQTDRPKSQKWYDKTENFNRKMTK